MERPKRRRWTLFSPTGDSLLELLVGAGIVAGVMGAGIIGFGRGYLDLTKQTLVDDLRRARMQATLKGSRYRFEAQGSQYVIARLVDDDGDGVWQEDPAFAPRTVELPSGYSIAAGSAAEFDGRGLLVASGNSFASIISVTLRDHYGQRKVVQIWPSGQIEEALS